MGLLRYLDMLHARKRALPWVLVGATLLLGVSAPIPSWDLWTKGYTSIYGPFLFVGVFCYLREVDQVSRRLLSGFIGLVLCNYYYLIAVHQPKWLGTHFATLAYRPRRELHCHNDTDLLGERS